MSSQDKLGRFSISCAKSVFSEGRGRNRAIVHTSRMGKRALADMRPVV